MMLFPDAQGSANQFYELRGFIQMVARVSESIPCAYNCYNLYTQEHWIQSCRVCSFHVVMFFSLCNYVFYSAFQQIFLLMVLYNFACFEQLWESIHGNSVLHCVAIQGLQCNKSLKTLVFLAPKFLHSVLRFHLCRCKCFLEFVFLSYGHTFLITLRASQAYPTALS